MCKSILYETGELSMESNTIARHCNGLQSIGPQIIQSSYEARWRSAFHFTCKLGARGMWAPINPQRYTRTYNIRDTLADGRFSSREAYFRNATCDKQPCQAEDLVVGEDVLGWG
jgi:hypothetical protein